MPPPRTMSHVTSAYTAAAAAVRGRAHQELGLPCQDAFALGEARGGVLVAAVADGAGSAALAEVGARIAAETAVEAAHARLDSLADDGAQALRSVLIYAVGVA